MKRKINLVGPNTLTVSLPAKIVKKLNLKKGDELELIEEGNNIVLSSDINSSEEKSITIDITGLSYSSMWRCIRSAYCMGFTKIEIVFNSLHIIHTSQRRKIRNEPDKLETYVAITTIVHRLHGMSIVEHYPNKVTVKETSRLNFDDFDVFLKRILKLVYTIANEVLEAIKLKDDLRLRNVYYFDDDINDWTYSCLKMLNVNHQKRTASVLPLLIYLEKIGDLYINIVKTYLIHNVEMDKVTESYFKKTNNLYHLFLQTYLTQQNIGNLNNKSRELDYELLTVLIKSPNTYLFDLKMICDLINESTEFLFAMKSMKSSNPKTL